MRKLCLFYLFALAALLGCQWQLSSSQEQHENPTGVVIDRFDRVESLYLTMADYAALRQMKTDYPLQTRNLVENVLQLGKANDPQIDSQLLTFFQDTTLQTIINDVERIYERTNDLEKQLSGAFKRLQTMLPGIVVPRIYTQIGSLDQSIVVDDSILGISLDKYLGADHPVYLRYGYTEQQRSMMTREYIVPDCLGFYLLSLYPMSEEADSVPELRRWHMSKIQSVVNQAMGRKIFANDNIEMLARYRQRHPHTTTHDLLMLDRHLPMVEEKR